MVEFEPVSVVDNPQLKIVDTIKLTFGSFVKGYQTTKGRGNHRIINYPPILGSRKGKGARDSLLLSPYIFQSK
jgi:hypothetical protein